MKKISILIAVMVGLTFASFAQTATTMSLAAGDTITNTGTSSKVITLTGGYSGIVVQVNVAKISGTVAGTVQLQISNDNTNWTNSGSAFTMTNVATQGAAFVLTAPVPVYVRALCTGSGTMAAVQTVKYVVRKYQLN